LIALILPITLSNKPVNSPGYVQGESTEVSDDITEDTTWYLAGSPYILVKDIKVYTAALLTIEPGVVVKFANGTELYVAGGLKARGNTTHPITFTSNFTTPTPGIWDSVIFDGIKEFVIDYVLIEYASIGIKLVSVANISNSVISNCNTGVQGKLNYANNLTATDNTSNGLSITSSLRIENSNASHNDGQGITVTATIDMNNCTVSNNNKTGVVLSNGGYIQNSCIIGNSGNGTSIFGPTTIKNSTISDNGGDGIWARSGISITECTIIGNKGNGVKSNFVDEKATIKYSTISSNGGDGISTNASLEIERCDISYNNGNGVIVHNNVNMSVSASNIQNNTLTGLSGRGHVSYSNVSGNSGCGIMGNFTVESFTNITWNQGGGFNGTGRIFRSSIFNNTPYDAIADIWPNNTTATYNWWGTDNGTLIEEHIWHRNDTESLGYVFYDPWLHEPPELKDDVPPEIVSVIRTRTNPPPYDPDPNVPNPNIPGQPRPYEPVLISVNVTDNITPIPSGVGKVLLFYRVNGSEWWNTTMTLITKYNETSGNWTAIIPMQPSGSIVEFFVQAYDKAGNWARTPPENEYYGYTVKWLPIGDINGDGKVDMKDIGRVAKNFGQHDC